MSRFVVPARPGVSLVSDDQKPDGFSARLVKYIPAEILAIFTLFVGGAASLTLEPGDARTLAAGAMAATTLATAIDVARRAPAGVVRKAHLVVSPIAFVAWAYPISSALLGDWFIGYWCLVAQFAVALLAYMVAPVEK